MRICRGRCDITLRVFPIGKRKLFAAVRVRENTARDQTYCRRRRAAALHADDEFLLIVRLLRKWNWNIDDLFIEFQSLFKDRFGTVNALVV